MNQETFEEINRRERVPHMRGDEPLCQNDSKKRLFEFPTCVGMNQIDGDGDGIGKRVPHMRGDEPGAHFAVMPEALSSPHAWG